MVPRAYVQGCCELPPGAFQLVSVQPLNSRATVGLLLQPSHSRSMEQRPWNEPEGVVTLQVLLPRCSMVTVSPTLAVSVLLPRVIVTGTGDPAPVEMTLKSTRLFSWVSPTQMGGSTTWGAASTTVASV